MSASPEDAGQIVDKFEKTFNAYWADADFARYEATEEHRRRFSQAVESSTASDNLAFLDVWPYPFQEEILERLEVERKVHNCTRNLVVAATGTGKTVVAALDYKCLRESHARPFTLLFVAHREEILRQSRNTFRCVLRDESFGELLIGGHVPYHNTHVFASVQSLARVDLSRISPNAYQMVIVDEFHHAAAPTYDRLLQHLQPRFLLGLTATPERADGKSVLDWFNGRIAAELRLWDAIDRGLLCPFQYFGIHDGTDLSRVRWVRGRYDEKELSRLYTADDVRVRRILQALRSRIAAPSRMRVVSLFCCKSETASTMKRKRPPPAGRLRRKPDSTNLNPKR